MRRSPISMRPEALRFCVPYVASAQMREQKGSAYFRATDETRRPHRWHQVGARILRTWLRIAIFIFSIRAKH